MVRLLTDAERFQLLHGPYAAPRCRIGDKLDCEYRDREVRVRGITDAPIPWPSSRRTGSLSPILCGGLARAVRAESELAVAHHWGVRPETVGAWRRALGVPRTNEGTRRLHEATQPERWDPQSLDRARRKSRLPRARAKMSATRKGRPPHPHFRAAAAAAARRPKPESFKRKTARRMRREWRLGLRRGHPPGRAWTEAEVARLGSASDAALARALDRTPAAVQKERLRRGIPACARPARRAETTALPATRGKVARGPSTGRPKAGS